MTNSTVPLARLVAWLENYRTQVTEQRAYLTELDSAIGDADHGANSPEVVSAVRSRCVAANGVAALLG